MELILILTGLAMICMSANRISRLPRPVSNVDQLIWQADLHFALAVERLKESIEQDKLALKSPKTRTVLLATADVREHLQSIEGYLSWLESVQATYTDLMEQSRGDSRRQRKLLRDWRQFTDAVWAGSNTDEWQKVYMKYGLALEDEIYENARQQAKRAEETANRLFGQSNPA